MKTTIVFSDTHLTDQFDIQKYNYLKNIIADCDQLIVLGDFWSYYSCTYQDFVKSNWSQLFDLMLKKKCIYITGNHDYRKWSKNDYKEFSKSVKTQYHLKVGNKVLTFRHGHNLSIGSIQNERYIFWVRRLKIDRVTYAFNKFIIKALGLQYYVGLGKRINKVHKKHADALSHNSILVCGHTHSPEFDLKNNYINTGFINYNHGFYLKIKGNELNLISEKY